MRISELSDRSGVSVATIKYYAREGLLPAGTRTGYNQTDYDETHVARLRLIRSLIDVGGLPVATTRDVLAAADDPDLPLGQVLGRAQYALPAPTIPPTDASVARIRRTAADRGWQVHDDNPGIRTAAAVLDSYTAIGRVDLADSLPEYARAAEIVGVADLQLVENCRQVAGTAEVAQTVVVGTVLGDALFTGLRRMAQDAAAATRYPQHHRPRHHSPHPENSRTTPA